MVVFHFNIGCKAMHGARFWHGGYVFDYDRTTETFEECARQCYRKLGCHQWTFNNKNCLLLSSVGKTVSIIQILVIMIREHTNIIIILFEPF